MTLTKFFEYTLFYALAIVLAAGGILIAGEMGMRTYYFFSSKQRPLLLPHPYLGQVRPQSRQFVYSYEENSHDVRVPQRTNSFGLMGKEFSPPKPSNTFRVLLLGDSFTEGVQVREEEKFSTLLATDLNERLNTGGKRVEVINAGVSGYSPISMYLFYKRKLAKLNSDLVIVQLFANDVFEDNRLTATSLLDEEGLPIKLNAYFVPDPPKSVRDLTFPFEEYSIFNRVREAVLRISRLAEFFYAYQERAATKSTYNKSMSALYEYDSGHQFFICYDGNWAPLETQALRDKVCAQSQKYILGIRDMASRSGAGFMMFYIPMEGQLKREQYSEHVRIYTAKQYSHYWNDRLKELSDQYNVAFLDLLPVFQEHEKESLFLDRDGHLTPRGHELVAEELDAFIRHNGSLIHW